MCVCGGVCVCLFVCLFVCSNKLIFNLNFQVCNFIIDCIDGSDELDCPERCDFERSSCGWKEVFQDKLDWHWTSGETASTISSAPK